MRGKGKADWTWRFLERDILSFSKGECLNSNPACSQFFITNSCSCGIWTFLKPQERDGNIISKVVRSGSHDLAWENNLCHSSSAKGPIKKKKIAPVQRVLEEGMIHLPLALHI